MKILELFGGYSSQYMALKRLGIDCKHDISEIDQYAIKANELMNGECYNWGDITKINEKSLPNYDLITYSSPCQDFSTAGKQAGGEKGSGTRSSLLWECERIIRENKPKYLLMENVKGLVSKKFKPSFDKWLETLEEIGYKNYWQVLNAKDFGVPQNRERVFVVSIRNDIEQDYKFPEKKQLARVLKDLLEPLVDEKYYLSNDKVDKFISQTKNGLQGSLPNKPYQSSSALSSREHRSAGWKDEVINTLCARDYKDPKVVSVYCAASRGVYSDGTRSSNLAGSPTEQRLEINDTGCANTLTTVQKDNYIVEASGVYLHDSEAFAKSPLKDLSRCLKASKHDSSVIIQVGNIVDTGNFDNPQVGRVYSSEGVSPCLNTMQGGGREPKIVINPLKGQTDNGWHFEQQVYDSEGLTRAVKAGGGSGNIPKVVDQTRIRKLTPRECWRLMGVDDADFDKLISYTNEGEKYPTIDTLPDGRKIYYKISKSQLYKLAGNSIVVDVLVEIFRNLFGGSNA